MSAPLRPSWRESAPLRDLDDWEASPSRALPEFAARTTSHHHAFPEMDFEKPVYRSLHMMGPAEPEPLFNPFDDAVTRSLKPDCLVRAQTGVLPSSQADPLKPLQMQHSQTAEFRDYGRPVKYSAPIPKPLPPLYHVSSSHFFSCASLKELESAISSALNAQQSCSYSFKPSSFKVRVRRVI
jgi:hypothetical protein